MRGKGLATEFALAAVGVCVYDVKTDEVVGVVRKKSSGITEGIAEVWNEAGQRKLTINAPGGPVCSIGDDVDEASIKTSTQKEVSCTHGEWKIIPHSIVAARLTTDVMPPRRKIPFLR